ESVQGRIARADAMQSAQLAVGLQTEGMADRHCELTTAITGKAGIRTLRAEDQGFEERVATAIVVGALVKIDARRSGTVEAAAAVASPLLREPKLDHEQAVGPLARRIAGACRNGRKQNNDCRKAASPNPPCHLPLLPAPSGLSWSPE